MNQSGHGMNEAFGGQGGRIMVLLDSLDLDSEQRKEIRACAHENRQQVKNLKRNRDELKQAIADDLSPVVIKRLADSEGVAMARLIMLQVRMGSHIHALLSIEQQEQMGQLSHAHGMGLFRINSHKESQ